MIISTAEAYEKESLDELRSYFTDDLSKPLYAVGPLLPPNYGSDAVSYLAEGSVDVRAFLDEACAKYGKQSTLFV